MKEIEGSSEGVKLGTVLWLGFVEGRTLGTVDSVGSSEGITLGSTLREGILDGEKLGLLE